MAEKANTLANAATVYGRFDPEAREYVISRPATPLPWINYLGSKALYSIVSNTGGGYSFYKDAKLRRLTRYRYDAVPLDNTGKYLYIADGDCVWNPGWRPTRTPLDEYECHHGLGYTRILSSKNGVAAELTMFVVDDDNVELQVLRLRNVSNEPKTLQLFSYVEWCLWNAEDDNGNLQRSLSIGEVYVERDIVCHTTGYRERRNHYAFHTVNRTIDGFDTDREAFLGPYGEPADPAAVRARRSTNSTACGWWPIGSLSVTVPLAPGGSDEIVFATGYAENDETAKWAADQVPNLSAARLVRSRLHASRYATREFDRLRERWRGTLAQCQAATPEPELDQLVNTWNPYQCLVNFELARSASLFETGRGRGIGFRDSNQDCLGVVCLAPERVRRRLLDLACTQRSDGSAYHQYQPLTKTGNSTIGSGFNDDPLWLVLSVAAYVRETGDLGFLDAAVAFEDTPHKPSTMREHLEASLRHTLDRLGEHRLPLIGRADWNDCLNLNAHSSDPDESFQTGPMRSSGRAESVMIGALFVLAARDYADLCQVQGERQSADDWRAAAESMAEAIAGAAWDGAWFLRAFDHKGRAIGSSRNDEGQIYLEPQGLCGMADIGGDAGLVLRALDSVAGRLAREYGLQILDPPYRRYHSELGEISTYLPGYKENGAVFCHNNPWIIIAETRQGNGDRAMRYLRAIAPTYPKDAGSRRTEPYVYAQMVAGTDAPRPGEAKNSWLTGTASWSYVAVTQHILGVRPTCDGLTIDPCIPADWPGFSMTRTFRGARYEIEVGNPRRVCRGVRRLQVDGVPLVGNTLPPAPAGTTVRIEVELG